MKIIAPKGSILGGIQHAMAGRLHFNAAGIAEESCRIVGTPGFYPDRKVDVAYINRFMPMLEDRLRVAGARLATMLNRLLR